MAALTIRNVPDGVRSKLRVRAARNGRSMEAEARAIIASAVDIPEPVELPKAIAKLQTWIERSSKSKPKHASGKVDTFIRDRRRSAIREAIVDGYHPRELYKGSLSSILSEAGWTLDYIEELIKQSRS